MLTPSDIATTDLPRRLRGYDRAEVDRVLGETAARQQALLNERARLLQDLDRLERERDAAAALETELRDTLVSAQRDAEARRGSAASEAEQLLSEARSRAAEGRTVLAERRAEAEAELERLHGVEREFRARTRVVVLEALDRLDATASSQAEPAVEPEPLPEPLAPEPPPDVPPVTALAAAAAPSFEDDTDSIPILVDPPEFAPEPPPAAPSEPSPPFLKPLLLSAAIVVVGAGVAIGIWQLASDGKAPTAATATPVVETMPATTPAETAPPPPETEAAAPASVTSEAPAEPTAPPAEARFAVSAVGGDAWLNVREGSSSGKLLFEGFLYDGESRRFVARSVWMRVGDPTALILRVNGKRVRDLPPGTADLVVTPTGVRDVSLG